MLYKPFEGPALKVAWAKQKIEALEAALSSYAERVQYGFTEESEPENELVTLRFRFSEPPPSDVPLLIGDAIHNLRSALDLMINDIARLREIEDTSRLAFPFAKSEETLGQEITNRKLAKLGDDIVALVKDLKPYASGNRVLSAINELDIIDKHHMVMPIFQAVPFDEIHAGGFSILGMVTHMSPGGTITVRRGTPLKIRRQGGVTAIFPDLSPFPRQPVVEALNEMANLVSGIIETFETHLAGEGDNSTPTPKVSG